MTNLRDPDSDLLAAVKKADEERVREALARGANVDAFQTYDEGLDRTVYQGSTSALAFAVRSNRVSLVRCLIDAGAKPNQRDQFSGRTALIEAVLVDNLEMVELLLASGADPNLGDFLKNSLTFAIERGNFAIARCLAEHGAHAQTSALREAVRTNRPDLLEICIACGPMPNHAHPLVLALQRQWWDAVERILELRVIPAEEETSSKHTVFADAIREGEWEKVDLLLACGETPRSRNGANPLMVAIERENADLADRLLQVGAILPKKHRDKVREFAKRIQHQGLLRRIPTDRR
ncbi:MAG TPA: ankyrin repeat domain-containing protein [Fibrobacteria bacterium]|nr:ankyrin repeat domain-containing protein [Fibrobacteria bacterium]